MTRNTIAYDIVYWDVAKKSKNWWYKILSWWTLLGFNYKIM